MLMGNSHSNWHTPYSWRKETCQLHDIEVRIHAEGKADPDFHQAVLLVAVVTLLLPGLEAFPVAGQQAQGLGSCAPTTAAAALAAVQSCQQSLPAAPTTPTHCDATQTSLQLSE